MRFYVNWASNWILQSVLWDKYEKKKIFFSIISSTVQPIFFKIGLKVHLDNSGLKQSL